jgi:energy-converting hydrogenase Eha subunit G
VHWQTWVFGFSILFTVDLKFLVNLFCILHQVECQKYCKLVIYILADTLYYW